MAYTSQCMGKNNDKSHELCIVTVLQPQGGRCMCFFDRVCNGERSPVVVVVSTGHSTIAPLRRSSSPNLSGYHVLVPTCTTSSIDIGVGSRGAPGAYFKQHSIVIFVN